MYYFYINFPTIKDRKILIHKGECGYCQNGNGMQDSGSNEKGFWAGPFKELDHAETALKKLLSLFKDPPKSGKHDCKIISPPFD
jgi:hypothetical protein